jgi:hypothetical protein
VPASATAAGFADLSPGGFLAVGATVVVVVAVAVVVVVGVAVAGGGTVAAGGGVAVLGAESAGWSDLITQPAYAAIENTKIADKALKFMKSYLAWEGLLGLYNNSRRRG